MIKHIEDLPHRKFIDVIKSLSEYEITEKLDGVNLAFGVDEQGKFFTSRETKGGDRKYTTTQYEDHPANNATKSAHEALKNMVCGLERIAPYMRDSLKGQLVEVEVLFGRQPNAIVYGSNCIVFLRMIEGEQKNIDMLGHLLQDQTTTSLVYVTESRNGLTLDTHTELQTWRFAAVPRVITHDFAFAFVGAVKDLQNYENWLGVTCGEGWDFPNGDLVKLNLNTVKKNDRPLLKALRNEALQKNMEFKLRIKEHFLNVLRTIEPELRDTDVEEWEDFGIEGVVLQHKETGEQFKIVDKEVFSAINQFNHAIRNEIKNTFGGGRQKFDEATLGRSCDLYNGLLENLAFLLGIGGLSKTSTIKRTLRKYKGESLDETLKNIAYEIARSMNREAYEHASLFKHAVQIIIDKHIKMLEQHLSEYQENRESYRLTLKTGVEIRYTEEIHRRTLLLFADMKEELTEMLDGVNDANTPQDIVLALYGKQLLSIH